MYENIKTLFIDFYTIFQYNNFYYLDMILRILK